MNITYEQYEIALQQLADHENGLITLSQYLIDCCKLVIAAFENNL